MMDIKKFRETIKQRIYVAKISQDEWTYGIEECWKKEVEILSEDVPGTIQFLNTECTADEYSWISEILEELIEKTQSKELLDCYSAIMSKFSEECKKYNIKGSIQYAEEMLLKGDE